MSKAVEPKGTREAAIHEAGHALTMLALRQTFQAVFITDDEGEVTGVNKHDERLAHDFVAMRAAEVSPSYVDAYRHFSPSFERSLAITVAGHVAEQLDEELSCEGEFLSEARLEEHGRLMQALGCPDPVLRSPISRSFRFVLPEIETEPGSDVGDAQALGRMIGALTGTPPVETVVSAEATAARILMACWDQVDKLARSLMRRKSGRMTYQQVLRLVGDVPLYVAS